MKDSGSLFCPILVHRTVGSQQGWALGLPVPAEVVWRSPGVWEILCLTLLEKCFLGRPVGDWTGLDHRQRLLFGHLRLRPSRSTGESSRRTSVGCWGSGLLSMLSCPGLALLQASHDAVPGAQWCVWVLVSYSYVWASARCPFGPQSDPSYFKICQPDPQTAESWAQLGAHLLPQQGPEWTGTGAREMEQRVITVPLLWKNKQSIWRILSNAQTAQW